MINSDKIIINAAITGMVPRKKDNPAVPVSPDEIIEDAIRCHNAGASIVHLHARDANEVPTTDPEVFQQIYRGIRRRCPDLLLSGTLSGRKVSDVRQRMAGLGTDAGERPDFGSLTLGSMNFRTEPSINAPETIKTLALEMKRVGVKPELEIFNVAMAEYGAYLLEKRVLQGPQYANILLGSLGTLSAKPRNLVQVIDALPPHTIWAATGIGRSQFAVQAMAVAMGGHVRVGLEDNLWMDNDRKDPATNLRLIERLTRLATFIGRTPATPGEVRAALGMDRHQTPAVSA